MTDAELARLRAAEDIQIREQALRWLDRRAYARAELARRLRQKQFPSEGIERVLDRLKNAGVLNDEQFAREWIRGHSRTGSLGGRRVRAELRQKGLSDEVIELVWAETGETGEEQACEELAQRKWRTYRALPREAARRRLASFLTRRGFDVNDVIRAVDRVAPRGGEDTVEF
jgi:regulatory protein